MNPTFKERINWTFESGKAEYGMISVQMKMIKNIL